MIFLIALPIIAAAVALLVRRVRNRLVLLGAGPQMATITGRPLAVADSFVLGMFLITVMPIRAAMGFAVALGTTSADRHLVRRLIAPLRRARNKPIAARGSRQ
jgi:C4-dicarboxylate transporter